MSTPLDPRVQAALEELGVSFEVLPCEPELADTAAFCAHYRVSLEHSANAILVASRKEPRVYAMCLALATTRLDVNHTVRSMLGGARLSFAPPEETVALTGMMVGGVTPFGRPDSLPLFIDAAVMAQTFVILGGGNRSSKLKVAPSTLLRIPGARVVQGLAH